ncbi:MAG TPA: GGDEF domain-containing protein [Candidatus Baltobacteraceae bacterium]|jgi:EAL domain-containing protein (putative c-di-GMP-specific phosphodiesterase class I)/GGDEF domain-containing protein
MTAASPPPDHAVIAYDSTTGLIRHANEAALRLLGADEADLSRRPLELVLPAFDSIAVGAYAHVVAVRADGSEITVLAQREAMPAAGDAELQLVHLSPTDHAEKPRRQQTPAADGIAELLDDAIVSLRMDWALLGHFEGTDLVRDYCTRAFPATSANEALPAEFFAWTHDTSAIIRIADASTSPLVANRRIFVQLGARGILAVPFVASERSWILVLGMSKSLSRDADEHQEAYLHRLTGVLANALSTEDTVAAMEHAHRADCSATLDRLDEYLSAANRQPGPSVALMLVRVENGKRQDLSDLKNRLRATLRRHEFVGDLAENELAIIAPQLARRADSIDIGGRVLDVLTHGPEGAGVNMGIAFYPENAADRQTLLSRAREAVGRAAETRTALEWYDPGFQIESRLIDDLRDRVRTSDFEREFFLCFQPIVDMRSQSAVGLRSFVRLLDSGSGLLAMEDIPGIGRRTELMSRIDRWTFSAAVREAAQLPDNLVIHVSIAEVDSSFVQTVESLQRLESARLAIEVTQEAALKSPEYFAKFVDICHERGIVVGMSGFGTNSLNLIDLASLALDFVVIDRRFASRLSSTPNGGSIAKAVIDFAHRFDWRVIIAGVDDERTYRWLQGLNVDAVQGYHLAQPMTSVDLQNWLTHRARTK